MLCECGCGHGTKKRRRFLRGHNVRVYLWNREGLPDLWTRILQKTEITQSCWLWRGGRTSEGYGKLSVADIALLVHRVSYERHKGPIPKDRHIDHLCAVRNCLNPDHLQAVPPRINCLRGPRHNGAKRFCKRGHPFDAPNTYWHKRNGNDVRACQACARMRKGRDPDVVWPEKAV